MKTTDHNELLKAAGTFDAVLSAVLISGLSVAQRQAAERWAYAAINSGLNLAGSRADAAALRRLTDAGYLEAGGATKGKAHRLTVSGWFCAWSLLGMPSEELRAMLQKVAKLENKSAVTLPCSRQRLCMVWHLLPEAGPWMRKATASAAARRSFSAEAATVEGVLVPLLALGWAKRFVPTDATFWAVAVTPAGAAALADWPKVEIRGAVDEGQAFDAWSIGYERGRALAKTTPPESAKYRIAFLLPATAWQ